MGKSSVILAVIHLYDVIFKYVRYLGSMLDPNRPFAGSGDMVWNKLHWDANDAVRLSKQRKVRLDW